MYIDLVFNGICWPKHIRKLKNALWGNPSYCLRLAYLTYSPFLLHSLGILFNDDLDS